MSETTVKVGQIYRSNDKREQGTMQRYVKVVGFLPGSSAYAQITRVRRGLYGGWDEDRSGRVTSIKVGSLGVSRQSGYTLAVDVDA